jgi:hypothetical protein
MARWPQTLRPRRRRLRRRVGAVWRNGLTQPKTSPPKSVITT